MNREKKIPTPKVEHGPEDAAASQRLTSEFEDLGMSKPVDGTFNLLVRAADEPSRDHVFATLSKALPPSCAVLKTERSFAVGGLPDRYISGVRTAARHTGDDGWTPGPTGKGVPRSMSISLSKMLVTSQPFFLVLQTSSGSIEVQEVQREDPGKSAFEIAIAGPAAFYRDRGSR